MTKWKAPAPRKTVAALATTTLTLGLLTVGSVSAFAATVCNGELTENVTDGVTVAAGADCILSGITVEGDVTVAPGGWLDATSTTITGDVTATDPYGISIDGDSVGGDIIVGSITGGFVYLNDLAVAGNVELTGVDVEINDSAIAGALTTTGADYVDLLRTSVTGDASITGSPYGVSVNGSVITGSLSVTDSDRAILIGANADGTADTFGNTIGGGLNLTGNGGGGLHDTLQVAGTTVLGGIVLDANTPVANFGPGNTAGSLTGASTGTAPTQSTVGDGDQPVVVVVPPRNPGEFIWTIDGTSNLVNLGVAEEVGDHFQADGNLNNIRVTDTRITGEAWAVTGQLSDFTNGSTTASGKFLGWVPGLAENTVGAVAGAPVQSGFIAGDGLAVARDLGSAPQGHPTGSVILGAYLDLKLPVEVATGTYNATLTLTALS